ncbi:hypothetical protein T07_13053 [Trichinella nelsoni]|uniref:Uncharacterized protein n=1 Tax=Trichinella nelsoni TaxID=6336 RepID=A0A0V0RDZ6_9BILA|nr:hypothetical protein T07_13053 [Trichinella nelsoni]
MTVTPVMAASTLDCIPFGQHIMPTYGNLICGLLSRKAYILLELVLSSTKTMVTHSSVMASAQIDVGHLWLLHSEYSMHVEES